MSYEYTKTTARQRATIMAALRAMQKDMERWPLWEAPDHLQEYFVDHRHLDTHEIDTLCYEINNTPSVPIVESLEHTQPLDVTQPLPVMRERRKDHRAYRHVQSLYGEAVLLDVLENMKLGISVTLRSEHIRPLAYAAAALEFMRMPIAKSAKLTVERILVQIYDHTECELTSFHVPALELAESAMRAITEQEGKVQRGGLARGQA